MSVEIIGHRGARGLVPESSLAGFSAALDLKVDRVELDVGITYDGVIVVHHDRAINPDITRDLTGCWVQGDLHNISELTFAKLSQYDIGRIKPGSDYAQQFSQQTAADGSRIPSLAQVVALLKNHDHRASLCIEAKYSPVDLRSTFPLEAFAEILVAEISRLAIATTAVIQSFDWQLLHAIKALLPQVQVWHLTSQLPSFNTLNETLKGAWTDGIRLSDYAGSIPDMIVAAGGKVWNSDYESLNRQLIAQAHRLGLKVYAWTVNTESDFQMLLDAGIDGMVTDYPDRLINFLEKQK